ncbi:HAMP domain-containing protein [Agrobacterium vitis]|uniref:methyl-accepting chemotaxis protein n=1 Tax=Rhizobium/Agrobacterium group TaxID=227290 RepID=UPI0008DBEE1D|nr:MULTISPECIES: HAMP domain-containing methyl-accepting chemotaxis protein [Rhizobium/Agrobacterium group]MCF1433902.1 HAMP domain-containing protein [Allorhizobium ampelinum]MUO91064.1 HAMP domain-containing protein [Agrobacterium vitis]MUZ54640.1 HAMP domain-containing protein [Agrobacterium vitis]MUZ94200.1 HAMP domain-containing protein [Agrobacterium vitis]MVA41522.1 HAMP domain-containing protein [Agrobacterium vitis]
MKLSISSTVIISGVILAVGVVITLATAMQTLQRLKVNGPIYQQIVDSKDLIADILPPPLYLVEAYSLINESALQPDMAAINIDRLKLLKSQYQERRDYWKGTTLPDALRSKLQQDVLVKGDAFWAQMDQSVVPALSGADPTVLKAALNELKERFHTHEAAVNQLVDMGNTYGKLRETEAATETASRETVSYALGSALILLSLASIVIVQRRALSPLRHMTTAMTAMAHGDLDTPPPYGDRTDEIGEIAHALSIFRDAGLEKRRLEQEADASRASTEEQRRQREAERAAEAQALRRVVEELGDGLHRLAECNMRTTLDTPFDARFDTLRSDFNDSILTLQTTLKQVLDETGSLQTNSREMRDAADSLAKRTEQQAAALEETAAALEEVALTVKASTTRTRETRSLVRDARDCTNSSNDVVNNAIIAMQRIESVSGEIGTIIGVIDEIAFQTNLLALNAGVEAARAGEAGKGFAVVAQEVRELAQRSAGAAKQIKTLVDRSSTEVASGVKLVGTAGDALTQIGGFVTKIDDNIDAITKAAEEQAIGLQQISSSVNSLDQMTQQNAAMVEETNAISQTLADGAISLATLVNRFQLPATPMARAA